MLLVCRTINISFQEREREPGSRSVGFQCKCKIARNLCWQATRLAGRTPAANLQRLHKVCARFAARRNRTCATACRGRHSFAHTHPIALTPRRWGFQLYYLLLSMNQLIISLNEPFDRENPSRNRLPVANVLPVTLPISILLRGRKNVKHSRVLSRWKSGLAISYLFSRSFDNFRKYLRISRHRFFDTRQKVSEPNSFHQRGNDDVVEAKSKAMNNQQETVY